MAAVLRCGFEAVLSHSAAGALWEIRAERRGEIDVSVPLAVTRRWTGLPPPQTGELVNGFKVDFYWPNLGLVVETDGLRYHRTPAQQTRDRRRDQAHTLAGLTTLRFTHAQVCFEPGYVSDTLAGIAALR